MTETTPKANRPGAGDPVMAEVRRIKAELLKKFNHDMAAMARDARARQNQSGHPVITKPTVGELGLILGKKILQ